MKSEVPIAAGGEEGGVYELGIFTSKGQCLVRAGRSDVVGYLKLRFQQHRPQKKPDAMLTAG